MINYRAAIWAAIYVVGLATACFAIVYSLATYPIEALCVILVTVAIILWWAFYDRIKNEN